MKQEKKIEDEKLRQRELEEDKGEIFKKMKLMAEGKKELEDKEGGLAQVEGEMPVSA